MPAIDHSIGDGPDAMTHAIALPFDMTPPHRSVYEAFAAVCARDPARLALVFADLQFTYGDLHERVENVARRLQAMGVGKGDAFALFAQNKPEHIWCYYAAAKLGAMFVPINPNMTVVEVQFATENSRAKVLFYDEVAAEAVEAANFAMPVVPVRLLNENVPAGARPLARVGGPGDDFIVI
jgi:long-chain acyl-CoA synthetase